MKRAKTLSVTIVAMALFIAAGAAAKSKDFRVMVLRSAAVVAGTHLTSGNYNVQWQTHSPQATVTFLQDGKLVATAEGQVVDHGTKYPANEVMFDETADGARVIREIRFKGSSEVLVFNQ